MLLSLHYVMRILPKFTFHTIPKYQLHQFRESGEVSRMTDKIDQVRVLLVIHIFSFSLAHKILLTSIFLVDLQQIFYVCTCLISDYDI